MMIAFSLVMLILMVALVLSLLSLERELSKAAEAERSRIAALIGMEKAAEDFQAHLRVSIRQTERAIEKLRELSEPK